MRVIWRGFIYSFSTCLIILSSVFIKSRLNRYYSDKGMDLSIFNDLKSQGDFVDLRHGRIRYELVKTDDGEQPPLLAVFVPGFSTGLEMFDLLSVDFQEMGIDTLRFDMYGRGFSSCPLNQDNDREFFIQVIDDLLNEFGLGDRGIILVGGSMGGKVVLDYASEYPENIKFVVGIAPAVFLECPSIGNILLKLPEFLVDSALSTFGKYIFFISRDDIDWELAAELSIYFDNHIAIFRCIYSTIQNYLFQVDEFMKKTIGKLRNAKGIKILLIAGGQDKEVTIESVEKIQDEISFAEIVSFENENHFTLFTQPEKNVNPAIINFLLENR